jgi:hypothetical protein
MFRSIEKGFKKVKHPLEDIGHEGSKIIRKGGKSLNQIGGTGLNIVKKGANTLNKVGDHTLKNIMRLEDSLIDTLTRNYFIYIFGGTMVIAVLYLFLKYK